MRPPVRVCRIGRIMATLYSSIKDDLLAKIKDGTYKEGDIIPPEVELAKSYGVSRPTIRQALQILANDGYIEKRKRRGTIVTKPKVSQGLTMGVRSFEEDMSREGRVVRSTVVIFKREKASEEVAANLELKPRAEVYKLVRLRYVDEKPNVFVESYIPVEPYPNFESYDFRRTVAWTSSRRTPPRRRCLTSRWGTRCSCSTPWGVRPMAGPSSTP